MSKEEMMEFEGTVTDHIREVFTVELENGQELEGRISGKIRMHNIKIVPGDQVLIEVSSYDLTKGRITKRLEK